jgi:hypothetical protein
MISLYVQFSVEFFLTLANCPTFQPQSMEGIIKKMYKILVVVKRRLYIVFVVAVREDLFDRREMLCRISKIHHINGTQLFRKVFEDEYSNTRFAVIFFLQR